MQAVGIIPARLGSTRLPRKMLCIIDGKPLIQHTYERAQQCSSLSQVLVATDAQDIADAIHSFGGHAVLTSPQHPSGTDRIAEAAENLNCSLVVNIQGDEPCFDPQDINMLVRECTQKQSSMATLAHPISAEEAQSPHAVKVVFNTSQEALYFSRSILPYPRRTTKDLIYYKHMGIYAYTKDFLMQFVRLKPTLLEQTEQLEQLRALEHGYKIHVFLTHNRSISIDTAEDLQYIQNLYQSRKSAHA